MPFNQAQIIAWQQGADVAPVPDGLESITSPLSVSLSAQARLLHMADDVYDLSAESHIVKLIKVLLGGAGVGGIQRALLMVRMQQSLGSTHFFDLDAFYGAVLGARRNWKEALAFDPVVDLATPEAWSEVRLRDAEYRGRIARFATAVHRGCTVAGVRGIAEAMLGARVDVYESWMDPGLQRRTWAQTDTLTWAQTDAMSWDQINYDPAGEQVVRNVIDVRASVPLTVSEIFDLDRALDRIRPATSSIRVSGSIGSNAVVLPAKVFADSSRWDIRQQVRNVNYRGLLLSPADPEGAFISTVQPAWSDYGGEAWSLLVLAPATVAYSTPAHPDTGILTDPAATQTPPQESTANGVSTRFVPEFALADIRKILSGRAASESIISESPYYRGGSDTVRVGDNIPAIRPSSVANQATLVIDGLAVVTDQPEPPTRVRGGSFWTSPPRLATDETTDVLEVRFPKAVTFNVLSLKVSSFPAAITIEAWDPVTGTWINLASRTISRAVPYTISGAIAPGELHPYHQGPGHWTPLTFTVPHTTATHLRVVFDRIEAYGPVGIAGRATPYPVGLRDLDIGFRVRGVTSLPSAFPLEPVATTVNSWGIDVLHSMIVNEPNRAIDADEATSWICDAQAAADAVVNFYLDVSDADAKPVVFDELYMVPTHTGPTFNLYYSLTDPTTVDVSRAAPEDHLIEPRAIVGSVVAANSGDRGFSFSDAFESYIDLDTADFGLTTLPTDWWFGVQWYANNPVGTTEIFALGNDPDYTAGTLTVQDGTVIARIGHWSTQLTLPENPSVNDRLAAVVNLRNGVPEMKVMFRNVVYEAAVVTDEHPYLDTAIGTASTPDAPEVRITGDVRVTAKVQVIRGTITTFVFAYLFEQSGQLRLTYRTNVGGGNNSFWRIDESASTGATQSDILHSGADVDTTLLPDGVDAYVGATITSTDVTRMRAIRSTDSGATWATIGTGYNAATVLTWPDVATALNIGTSWLGRIYWVQMETLNAAGDPTGVVWRFDASEYPGDGATAWTDPRGRAWTATNTEAIKPVYDGSAFSRMRIGSSGTANGFRLTRLAMGRGEVIAEDFFTQPDAYTRNIQGVEMGVPGIFLRYHPDYYGHLTDAGVSWGFMGTIQDPWDLMVWQPIGQYTTTRGSIQFDQVQGRFLKLEFSNLTVEPYDSLSIRQRTIKRFPRPDQPPSGRTMTSYDLAVMNDVASPMRFPDSPPFYEGLQRNVGQAVSPTSGLVLIDSARRAEIGAATGYGFALQGWQPGSTMSMFNQVGTHAYATMIIEPLTRSAFFVGIKEIEVRRRNLRDMGDTPVYFDRLLTVDNVNTPLLTMNFEPGQAFTTEAASNAVMTQPESITSLPFYSFSSVTAVQIATQQTGPQQMIPDDEFSHPSLPGATFTSTGGWMASGDAALLYDAAFGGVRVTRDPEPLSTLLRPDTPVVHPPPTPVVSSNAKDAAINVGWGLFGGITSPQVQASPRGTLTVGTRVFADKEVGGDLFLRLYGADGTTMLAEQRFHPQPGVSTEAFLNYRMGTTPSKEASVQARVEQNGPFVGSWVMEALSAFDSSVMFEVSNDGGANWLPCNDVRNRAYGVVDFPNDGAALMWRMIAYRHNTVLDAVKLRPWYAKRTGSAQ